MKKIGLGYDECAKRIKRITKNPGHPEAKHNLVESIKNQCRLSEGEASKIELERECALAEKASFFSGTGNKSCGYGSGYKLGEGHWKFIDGDWVLR